MSIADLNHEFSDEEQQIIRQIQEGEMEDVNLFDSEPPELHDHVVVNETVDPPHFKGMVGIVRTSKEVTSPHTKEKIEVLGVEILGCTLGHDLDGILNPRANKRGWYFEPKDLLRLE